MDRRVTPRLRGPFEATWTARSGGLTSRLADISEGGCFVESLVLPQLGEPVQVEVALPGGEPLQLSGHVVYVFPQIGFGMKFALTPSVHEGLRRALARL